MNKARNILFKEVFEALISMSILIFQLAFMEFCFGNPHIWNSDPVYLSTNHFQLVLDLAG